MCGRRRASGLGGHRALPSPEMGRQDGALGVSVDRPQAARRGRLPGDHLSLLDRRVIAGRAPRGAPRNGRTGTDLRRPGPRASSPASRFEPGVPRQSGTGRAYLMFSITTKAPETAREQQQPGSGRRESNPRSQLAILAGDRTSMYAEVCSGWSDGRRSISFTQTATAFSFPPRRSRCDQGDRVGV